MNRLARKYDEIELILSAWHANLLMARCCLRDGCTSVFVYKYVMENIRHSYARDIDHHAVVGPMAILLVV